jgi:hypothetical protein
MQRRALISRRAAFFESLDGCYSVEVCTKSSRVTIRQLTTPLQHVQHTIYF